MNICICIHKIIIFLDSQNTISCWIPILIPQIISLAISRAWISNRPEASWDSFEIYTEASQYYSTLHNNIPPLNIIKGLINISTHEWLQTSGAHALVLITSSIVICKWSHPLNLELLTQSESLVVNNIIISYLLQRWNYYIIIGIIKRFILFYWELFSKFSVKGDINITFL